MKAHIEACKDFIHEQTYAHLQTLWKQNEEPNGGLHKYDSQLPSVNISISSKAQLDKQLENW